MKDNIAILIIHGFGGELSEVMPLCNLLKEHGYYVEYPILEGHGGSKEMLKHSTFEGWIESTMDSYVRLKEKYEKVVVVGFSMGGLIAVNLYNISKFDFLVTINTPIYYWNIKNMALNLKADFSSTAHRYFEESVNKPFNSLIEFLKILNYSKSLFKNVKCDTLVIQSLDDDVVNCKSAEYIYANVTGYKELCYYSYGGHIIINSNNANSIYEKINNFIRRKNDEDK